MDQDEGPIGNVSQVKMILPFLRKSFFNGVGTCWNTGDVALIIFPWELKRFAGEYDLLRRVAIRF